MARYEVALSTTIAFADSGAERYAVDDQVTIEFGGQRFVWHHHDPHALAPVISTIVADANDYATERLVTNRLLSALAFTLDSEISVLTVSATGFKREFDRPILSEPAMAHGLTIRRGVAALHVAADHRLRTVLGLYREGRAARSAFYRLLAFFNALDTTFDGRAVERDAYVDAHADLPGTAPAGGWGRHIRENFRNAVAHAVRQDNRPVLDPDDLDDWRALTEAAGALRRLVRQRVSQRWPNGIVSVPR